MTAGNILGRAWGRLRAASIGALGPALTRACLGIGLIAVLFVAVRMTLSESTEHQPAEQIKPARAGAAKTDSNALASAKLFGSDAAASDQETAPDRRDDLILSGILFFGGNNPPSRIMLEGYPNMAFAVGDRVTGDVVVDAIYPQYAVVSAGGRNRILRVSSAQRNPVETTDNGDEQADDDPSKPPPILPPYEDPVGDG